MDVLLRVQCESNLKGYERIGVWNCVRYRGILQITNFVG